MFSKEYCSKNRQMVINGLTIILLTGWHKNELSVLECAWMSTQTRMTRELLAGCVVAWLDDSIV